jgi:hypothetical protein
MSKFRLALGIHNHQPVGNFEAVFEEAHTSAYLPFLELVEKYDNIALSLHQSGILWHWQEKAHREYFELVGRLVDRGQVELLTGGFYEPILSSIPERDIRGQIGMLTAYLAEHFEVTPDGFWLTERIWEPHLPKVLAQSGVKFLPLDDTHFLYAGLELSQLTGPFVTESEGHLLTLLPIQKKLRYLIPFGTVEEVMDELKRQAEVDPSGLAIYADDGEKFGVWPNTHSHCYEDGWLEDLFECLRKNADWLEVVPLGKAAAGKPAGRVYLPTASYAEMLHWALPSQAFLEYEKFEHWLEDEAMLEKYGRFVRGGHWRGFLAKYEESNLMHKKMLSVSDKLDRFEQEHPDMRGAALPARERLYAGQCNCPYWHGVFGGLYLPHIRQAVYGNLIEADAALNELMNLRQVQLSEADFDADGHLEVVVAGETLSAVLKPGRGGTLIDLSLNKHGFSLTDTLTRRREGYHLKLDQAVTKAAADKTTSIHDLVLAKEEGLKDFLVEDWYLKRCFIDHFLTDDVDLERFRSGKFGEEGDFVLEPFAYRIDRNARSATMTRDGHLWRAGGPIPMKVVKTFRFADYSETIEVDYEVSSPHTGDLWVSFAVENNFNFQAGHAEDRFVRIDGERRPNAYLDSVGEHRQTRACTLVDEYRDLAVAISTEKEFTLWHLPIFTVSLSEAGFEKVYQGTTLVSLFRVNLGYQPFTVRFALCAGSAGRVAESLSSRARVNSV